MEKGRDTHCLCGRVGFRAHMDAMEEKKKFLLLPRIQTPDHLACGLVTILTMISQLPIRKTNNEKIIEGWQKGELRLDMSCELVHSTTTFELTLAHVTLVYLEDEGKRFIWKNRYQKSGCYTSEDSKSSLCCHNNLISHTNISVLSTIHQTKNTFYQSNEFIHI